MLRILERTWLGGWRAVYDRVAQKAPVPSFEFFAGWASPPGDDGSARSADGLSIFHLGAALRARLVGDAAASHPRRLRCNGMERVGKVRAAAKRAERRAVPFPP